MSFLFRRPRHLHLRPQGVRGLNAAVAALAMFLVPSHVFATVNSVTASPASATVSTSAPTVLSITWTVSVTIPGAAGGPPTGTEAIRSGGGQILAGGTQVQTLPQSFLDVVTAPTGTTVNRTFNETITVSPSVAGAILDAGGLVRREFAGGTNSAIGIVNLRASQSSVGSGPVTGAGAGQTNQAVVQVAALEISFENGGRYATASEGDRLRARADLSMSGTGVLLGTWEIADLTTATDDLPPRFRPLERVQRVVTGSARQTFLSPPLPTRSAGTYAVRFVTTRPSGVAPVQIRYAVIASTVPETLRLLAPPPGSVVSAETVFTWAGTPGAAAYRVEFAEIPARGERVVQPVPVAAIDLGADATSASALPFTLEALSEVPDLQWRVIAINADGATIAVSPFQRLGSL